MLVTLLTIICPPHTTNSVVGQRHRQTQIAPQFHVEDLAAALAIPVLGETLGAEGDAIGVFFLIPQFAVPIRTTGNE